MRRSIGCSTGAIAKGDFRRGLELNRRTEGAEAVELSALREGELFELVNAAPSLDLSAFRYVSFHAPSKLKALDESALVDALRSLPSEWPIVAHPEVLANDGWRVLGSRLCIENMDNLKTAGRSVAEVADLLDRFPEAGFCLDVGHARQIDPTMNVAVGMLRSFGHRLRQVHVSEVGPRGEHLPLSRLAQIAFARVARYLPGHCPVIIESVVGETEIGAEMETVRRVFHRAYAEELREHAYA
jgi:hypothetical protein